MLNKGVNQIENNISQLLTAFGQQQNIFKKGVNQIQSNISQLAAAFGQQQVILNELGKNNFNNIDNSCSLCPLPTSCQEIKNKQPNSSSGMYLLAISNNKL